MEWLFTILTDALSGSFGIALVASCVWGVLSIVLSPCHLSSIPLIIGFLTANGGETSRRGVLISTIFAVGIFVSIALIGVITGAMGRLLGDVGLTGTYAVAVMLVVVGLYLMDVLPLPGLRGILQPVNTRSVTLSAFIMGIVFGVGLGPCTFAFMAPVLAVVFQLAETNPLPASLLLLAFAIGHCVVIILAGASISKVQAYLNWTEKTAVIKWTKRIAGFFVVLGGIYTFFSV